MSNQQTWAKLFANWPANIARKGVLVTNFDEQVAFTGFMTNGELLLVERQTPDTFGARKLIVPLAEVQGVKVVEVVKSALFAELGFVGSIAGA
jgi:hypothetical protein